MPEATLKFDLSDPDDLRAHKRAVFADELAFALCDIAESLRTQTKYGEGPSVKVLDQFRHEFFQILQSHGIELDDLFQ
jgi:hypothetical protein